MKLNLLPARVGISWLKRGFACFKRQALGFTGLFSLLLTASMLLGVIPVVGVFLSLMALPTISLCMMVVTREVSMGGMALPRVMTPIFKSDKTILKKLLLLGALYGLGVLSIIALAGVISPEAFDLVSQGTLPEVGQTATGSMLLAFVSIGLLTFLLSLVFWHAPALIYWHQLPVLKSLFFSTIACLKNWRAYIVFAAMLLLMQVLGANIIIILTRVVAPSLFFIFVYLFSMLLGALMAAASYFAFIDCFGEPDDSSVVIEPITPPSD